MNVVAILFQSVRNKSQISVCLASLLLFRLRFAHRQLENQKFTGNEVEGLRKRMKEILRDRRASSFPMTIGIVLSLIILMCGISEYFRLQVIAAGVREAVEDAVISTVNDNSASYTLP